MTAMLPQLTRLLSDNLGYHPVASYDSPTHRDINIYIDTVYGKTFEWEKLS